MSGIDELVDRIDKLLTRLEPWLPEPPSAVDWHAVHACRWRKRGNKGDFEVVTQPSVVRLDDLLCIDEQKERITRNTRQFLRGLPANNVLLWGPRGTGKSSLIKAVLNEYADDGLRLLEVDRVDLGDLRDIVGCLRSKAERFIVYCDDLSFESDDAGYKTLKVVLDGTIHGAADNVLLYATSNRRHLVPEFLADNLDSRLVSTEIHHSETVEERLSLSERFGVWLSFQPFNQQQYFMIVNHWITRLAPVPPAEFDDAARLAAHQWSLLNGTRSGRSAWQFARDWVGRRGLAE